MELSWNTVKIRISELVEYEHNPRQISDSALLKLQKHIKEDGYHQRLLVNADNVVIGGHQRKKALLQAGYSVSDEIEVLKPNRILTQEELDRLNIRDNLAFGEFDFDILEDRFDLETLLEIGMTEEMLADFGVEDIGAEDGEDCAGELAQDGEPRAKTGDLYILGKHRLLCGDSTNPQHVEKLFDGANPVIMVTDPPYGVKYDPDWRNKAREGNDSARTGVVLNDDRYDWSDTYSLFTGDVAYVWHSSSYTHKFAENIENCGFDLINLIIWSKNRFALSRGDYHQQHEPCWYAVRHGKKHNWQGARDQSTVWEIDSYSGGATDGEEKTTHGTQKPLECMLKPILNNTKVGESVYDPFGGSGTTLIACEKSNRNCYMMELSPSYVDMIVARWEKSTGKKAELASE